MFGYITELDTVEIDPELQITVSVEGHDVHSLLCNFMDEFLFQFATNRFVTKAVDFIALDAKSAFTIRAVGRGERFDLKKHSQGTEVKAITYANMQILEREQEQSEDNDHQSQQQQKESQEDKQQQQQQQQHDHRWDVHVIVDI